jgi:DNA-directed RNA polymerase sigma subunit (sigma70/sigma32)
MNDDWITDLSWNHPTAHKDTDHYMTLEQISIELGVTRERARQIEQSALRKARRILESRGFKLEDLLY